MFSKITIFAILLSVIFLAYRCSVALQVPTAMDAQNVNTSLDTLVKGRELYIAKCNSCHNLYLPERYNKKEWQKIVNKMQKPTKITHAEADYIYKYLSAKSKQ